MVARRCRFDGAPLHSWWLVIADSMVHHCIAGGLSLQIWSVADLDVGGAKIIYSKFKIYIFNYCH